MNRKMNCGDLLERLELALTERLSERERSALEAHVETCENCRRLLELWLGDQKIESADSLVREILARTSGSACSRVRSILCDRVDEALPEDDTALVDVHLNYCTDCAQLASILEESAVKLPEMAALDPGPFFANSVVAVTSSIQQPNGFSRLFSGLSLIFQRPRFSLEAAYVGALLIFLVFGGAPSRSVGDIASATFAGFRLNLVKVVGDTPAVLSVSWNDFYSSCRERMEETVEATEKTIGGSFQSVQRSAERLKGMSDEHLLKPATALLQDITLKYEEYSDSLRGREDSDARSEEPAE